MKRLATVLIFLSAIATTAQQTQATKATAPASQPTKQQIVLGNGKTYPTSKLQFTNASAQRLNDLPDSTELYPVSNPYNSYNHDFQGTYPPQQNNGGR